MFGRKALTFPGVSGCHGALGREHSLRRDQLLLCAREVLGLSLR